jgi:hypothetical protein
MTHKKQLAHATRCPANQPKTTHLCRLAVVLFSNVLVLINAVLPKEGVELAVAACLHLLQLIRRPAVHGHRTAEEGEGGGRAAVDA